MQDQQLALTGGKLSTATISETLSQPLLRDVLSDDSHEAVVRGLVKDPEKHRLCREIVADVKRHAAPMTYDQFMDALGPLLLYCPPKDLPAEREAKVAWFMLGFDVVKHNPLEAFKAAVSLRIQTDTYKHFPPWGALNKLAEPTAVKVWRAAGRVIAAARAPAPVHRVPPTDEEREAIRRDLANLKAGGLRAMASTARRPTESPQEMAARLRQSAG